MKIKNILFIIAILIFSTACLKTWDAERDFSIEIDWEKISAKSSVAKRDIPIETEKIILRLLKAKNKEIVDEKIILKAEGVSKDVVTFNKIPIGNYLLVGVAYGNRTKVAEASSEVAIKSGTSIVSLKFERVASVAVPSATPATRIHTTPQSVELLCNTTGAAIFYTLDGLEPDEKSSKYTSPILITKSTTLKAIGIMDGLESSKVFTCRYIITGRLEAPKITESGTFTTTTTITIKVEPDTKVLYTTDKSDPSPDNKNAKVITETTDLLIESTTMVIARAYKEDWKESEKAIGVYVIYKNELMPKFTKEPGEYLGPIKLGIDSEDKLAKIYYTLDGTEPNENSQLFGKDIDISATTTVKAIAVRVIEVTKEVITSKVLIGEFVITNPATEEPLFSPSPGLYNTPIKISLSCKTEGAQIYYSTTKQLLRKNYILYKEPIQITSSSVILAYASKAGTKDSAIVEGKYTINYDKAAKPEFSPDGGKIQKGTKVTISTNTAGATIYYTLDGSIPTEKSNKYIAYGIIIDKDTTLSAIAVNEGMENSVVNTVYYQVILDKTMPPIIKPQAGNYNEKVIVSIEPSVLRENTKIYYTLDGKKPSVKSSLYTAPFTLTKSATVIAVAQQDGMEISDSTTAAFTILTTLPKPSSDFVDSVYDGAQNVTIKYDSSYSVIMRYTTDGTEPNEKSTKYNNGINVEKNTVIKVKAFKEGYQPSETLTLNLKIRTPKPVITFDEKTSIVKISDSAYNVRIYYTTDGTKPTTGSSLYLDGIKLEKSTTIFAIAHSLGMEPSEATTASYTLLLTLPIPVSDFVDGIYDGAQNITIKYNALNAATLKYTIDGTEPNEKSLTYTNGISVEKNTVIKVKAFREGYVTSETLTLSIKIKTPIPVISYDEITSIVKITTKNSNTKLYYTIDGTNPTTKSLLYTGAITLNKCSTISAIALEDNMETSNTVSTFCKVISKLPTPVSETTDGIYDTMQNVVIKYDSLYSANIKYTIDGTDPNEKSLTYTNGIKIEKNAIVKVKAFKEGYFPSDILTLNLKIKTPKPTIAFDEKDHLVKISLDGYNAKLYYTTDGTNPTIKSLIYVDAIPIRTTTTIKAIAQIENMEPSDLVTETYSISLKLSAPISDFIDGIYDNVQNIILSSPNSATIKYTTDGTDPNENSQTYYSGINVERSTTIKAKAYKEGYTSSDIFVLNIKIRTPKPAILFELKTSLLYITNSISDAKIYYTLDGKEPNLDSAVYTKPVLVSNNLTVKAFAYAAGMEKSYTEEKTITDIKYPLIKAEIIPGTKNDSIKVLLPDFDSSTGNYIKLVSGSTYITPPDTLPSNYYYYSNIGANIVKGNGVLEITPKYWIQIYEVDGSHKILRFNQIELTESMIAKNIKPIISFNKTEYNLGEQSEIKVIDGNANVDDCLIDKISINLMTSQNVIKTFEAVESSIDSGIFILNVNLIKTITTSGGNLLNVIEGDLIAAEYSTPLFNTPFVVAAYIAFNPDVDTLVYNSTTKVIAMNVTDSNALVGIHCEKIYYNDGGNEVPLSSGYKLQSGRLLAKGEYSFNGTVLKVMLFENDYYQIESLKNFDRQGIVYGDKDYLRFDKGWMDINGKNAPELSKKSIDVK